MLNLKYAFQLLFIQNLDFWTMFDIPTTFLDTMLSCFTFYLLIGYQPTDVLHSI